MPIKILLDTGAAVSVARYEFLPKEYRQKLTESPGAVGANGMPLDVVGRAKIAVSLGSFCTEEEFTVIRNLTVDCLLGADFLKEHGAVMDCQSSTLSIGKDPRCQVPMFMGHRQPQLDSVAIIAPVDMEIPGRTVQLIQGELKDEHSGFSEALVEPMSGTPPTNFCIARTLSPVTSGREVILQVMNISPTPITIYKGMMLGEAIPRHNVMLVEENANDRVDAQIDQSQAQSQAQDFEANLDRSDLTSSEKQQLKNLLSQFSDLFAPKGGPVGQTPAVKHSIPTEGPPV